MTDKRKVTFMIEDESLRGIFKDPCESVNCRFVSSKEDFVQAVFDDPPHLLVIDERFKKGQGRSVALTLKEDLVLKCIPVVLLVDEGESAPRVKDAAIDFFFKKSGASDGLPAFVKKVLDENLNAFRDFGPPY
ncbi:MAG: hypothetical protein HYZ87_01065 [Candidatus Omnitrophica bacterium]|nr:hypothetical protein [Candidatus Omnitrophota bacterium]